MNTRRRGPSRHRVFGVAVFVSTSFSGCSLLPTDSPRTSADVQVEWRANDQAWSHIRILGDQLIYATVDGFLVARDRRTGTEIWRTPGVNAGVRDLRASWALPVSGNTVVWSRERLMGVRSDDGAAVWTYVDPFIGLAGSGPDIAGGGVYDKVGRFTFRLDLGTGSVVWRDSSPDERTASGVHLDASETSVAVTRAQLSPGNPYLILLDARTGARRWSAVLRDTGRIQTCCADVVLADGLVVLLDYRDSLRAFDEATGAVRWSTRSAARGSSGSLFPVPGGIVEVQSGIQVRGEGGSVNRYDTRTGALLWNRPLRGSGSPLSGASLNGDRLAFGLENGTLAVIDVQSGDLLLEATRQETGIGYFISVAAVDDWLYTSDGSGSVYGLRWRP